MGYPLGDMRPVVREARLQAGHSGPRYFARSLSSCPRCHASGSIGSLQRQQLSVSPRFMRRW